MNNETPEAALRSRIADLEQQLKLSDEGCSRLAARCLDLEKEVQSYLAAHPQREMPCAGSCNRAYDGRGDG